ncbi:MAG: hypothetical protein GY699_06995 [Desulfobacteraceae bacterium]|nr:hypothetical protein [Desulfobacteraceae bacterium]
MPGCTFSVSGKKFKVDKFLKKALWKTDFVYRLDDPIERRPGHFYLDSGFSMTVSNSDGSLPDELYDVEKFMDKNWDVLKVLVRDFETEELCFDFGYYCRLGEEEDDIICISQGEYLEPSFLKKCGELGIGVALSLYPKDED